MQRADPRIPENAAPKANTGAMLRAALSAVAVLLTYLLVVPHPLGKSELIELVRSMHWSGYVVHFLTYLVLATVVLLLGRGWGRADTACVMLLAGHALLTETAQAWVPSRSFDLWDAAANLGGIAVACVVAGAWAYGRRLMATVAVR